MKKLFFVIVLMGFLAGFASCSHELNENLLIGSSQTRGSVVVHTLHYGTHMPVDSMLVQVVGCNTAVLTDAQGCAVFELPVGKYELQITRPGYLGVVQDVEIELVNKESDTPVAQVSKCDVDIFPLTGMVEGYVTLQDDKTTVYQAGAKVKVSMEDRLALFETQTDDKGYFMIDSLPEGRSFTFMAEYIAPNAYYRGSTPVRELGPGESLKAPTICMSFSAPAYQADIVGKPQKPSEALTITFPVAVDLKQIKPSDISVINKSGNKVGVSCRWSDDDRTLSIYSIDSDGWCIGSEEDYTYNLSLQATDRGRIVASGTFGINSFTGLVAVVSAAFDSAKNTLSWTKLDNADTYHIYVKKFGRNDYEKIYTYNDLSDTELIVKVHLSRFIFDYGVYAVKVIGANADSEGNILDTREVTINYTSDRNVINPQVSYDSYENTISWMPVAGASYYHIYRKKQGDDDYVWVKRVFPRNALSLIEVHVPSCLPGGEYGEYYLKVIGATDEYSGMLDAVTPVMVYYDYYN